MSQINYCNYYEQFKLNDEFLLRDIGDHYAKIFAGCKNVADLGCGMGDFLEALKRAGVQGVGVEINASMADIVRSKGFECINENLFEYIETCPPGRHDGFFLAHVIEHLHPDGLLSLIESLYEKLAPGGVATLVFPNVESLPVHLSGFWIDPTHVRFYDPGYVRFAMREHGFTMFDQPYYETARPRSLSKRIGQGVKRFFINQLGLKRLIRHWEAPPEVCIVGKKS